MEETSRRFKREFDTVRAMTAIYCAANHPRNSGLCEHCTDLMTYVHHRLEKCPYGTAKPACSECPIHCYGAAEREKAKTIMRFSGPLMLTRHPFLALAHLWDKWRAPSRIREWQKSRKQGKTVSPPVT